MTPPWSAGARHRFHIALLEQDALPKRCRATALQGGTLSKFVF